MSNNRIQFTGLDALQQALRSLPADLARQGGTIVAASTASAGAAVVAAYPEVSGNLKSHVKVTVEQTQFGTIGRVRSTAKHAFIFENGTQTRQTSLGHNRGAMPPGNVFVPTVVRTRRAMVQQLIQLVNDQGLRVTGG
jgi:hypothetical protein